ncbi:MAG: cation:proton antiporter [Oscillospiraceae bacterium]|nr:cation:proton antiporter [Oscillospiraceae bacterium]
MQYYLILLPIALLLIVSKVLMKFCSKIGLPGVIGMLLAGILVGLIKYIPGQTIFNETSLTGIGFFAQIGVILILFTAGLETDLNQIKSIGGPAVIITCAGVIVPMGLGFLVATLCNGGFAALNHDTIITNIFYGTILTATSVSVTVSTLREIGKLSTKVGSTIIAAAIIDDILGIIALSVVIALKSNGSTEVANPLMVILKTVLFFVVVAIIAFFASKLFRNLDTKYPHHRLIPIFSLAFCFIIAYVSERWFGIADITGAYIVGLILSTNPDKQYIVQKSDILGYMIFVPLFFGNIGISTEFAGMNLNMLFFGIMFILAGIIGKIIGCGGAALLCKYKFSDSLKVGIGMMARAEVALVTAQKGVEAGIITSSVMPFIVLLIVVTSFITPIALQSVYHHDEKHEIALNNSKSQKV